MTNLNWKREVVKNLIESDGRTVWVNAPSGMCIGRFSAKGIDVHADGNAQLCGDATCLDCIHSLPFEESWERFKASMLKHHRVAISDDHKPTVTRAFA